MHVSSSVPGITSLFGRVVVPRMDSAHNILSLAILVQIAFQNVVFLFPVKLPVMSALRTACSLILAEQRQLSLRIS